MAFNEKELKNKDLKSVLTSVEKQKKVDKGKDEKYTSIIIKELVRSIGRLESRIARLEERLK